MCRRYASSSRLRHTGGAAGSACLSSMSSEVALLRSSPSKAVWLTLMPTPGTTKLRPSMSAASSLSTPTHFLPPRITSLGHLMPGSRPGQTSAMAPAAASAAASVQSCACSVGRAGLSTSDCISAVPAGVSHVRRSRPRPAVCRSHTARLPAGAPARASSLAVMLVEAISLA